MKDYIVSVPVYATFKVSARTPEIAAEAGRDFAHTSMLAGEGWTPVEAIQNGVRIETARFEGLDDDDTPDVYELIGGKEVRVYPAPVLADAA